MIIKNKRKHVSVFVIFYSGTFPVWYVFLKRNSAPRFMCLDPITPYRHQTES